MVERFLANPDRASWNRFREDYLTLLEQRFEADRKPFDQVAALAQDQDLFLGCSCPTKTNPDVWRCHTVLALEFMQRKFPDLDVRFPENSELE